VAAELRQPGGERVDPLAVTTLAGDREHVDRELRPAGERPQLVDLVAER
jgi:hypothetical protein